MAKFSWLLEDDFEKVLFQLHCRWYNPAWGFKRRGRVLRLHTGGWSGNEELVGELQRSMFWSVCWEKSERGGHYLFCIPKNWPAGKLVWKGEKIGWVPKESK